MHILLTNDDGPPNPQSSPYIAAFVRTLRSPPFNHKVSVVLPSTQRSWIGKAHLLPASHYPLAGQQPKQKNEDLTDLVTPSYFVPSTGQIHSTRPTAPTVSTSIQGETTAAPQTTDPTTDPHPHEEEGEEDYWVLVPGTPATCIQLGLFNHPALFPSPSNTPPPPRSLTSLPDTPVDLVLSGPNHGRNTTAAFALSSGTVGGALEGALCGVRSVALSFAFFTRVEDDVVVGEACELAARVVDGLWRLWEGGGAVEGGQAVEPDLYTVNVPLVAGVSRRPVRWTWMLDNKWSGGSLYRTVDRLGEEDVITARNSSPSFKWAPSFADVWRTVEGSRPGNDGLTIRDGCTSVTPLMANFQGLHGLGGFVGEVKL